MTYPGQIVLIHDSHKSISQFYSIAEYVNGGTFLFNLLEYLGRTTEQIVDVCRHTCSNYNNLPTASIGVIISENSDGLKCMTLEGMVYISNKWVSLLPLVEIPR